MLARAMERWNLHKRIALYVLRLGGRSLTSLIFSMMAATAFLSMWVSNTATTMMMLPIGQSIVATAAANSGAQHETDLTRFSAGLMLGIAYAATIGGMGTLIGTPPNALFAGFMSDTYGVNIGFSQWMMVGVPIVVILLPVTWLVLTRLAFGFATPEATISRPLTAPGISSLGPMSRGEISVAIVVSVTALAWVFRPLLINFYPALELSDAGIAMAAALLLFIIPADWSKGQFLLSWSEAITIRWDVLILFGGGLALATALTQSGLVNQIAGVLKIFGGLPLVALVLIVMFVVVYLGELASNTAMAAIFLPIAAAVAVSYGIDPMALTMPVALAASLGFMLPVATPPNAIIYGGGAVTAHQMLRAGALLDIICTVIVAAMCMTFGFAVMGLVKG
jgi:sodium-dependent dicarboxylate transporter 2/3/5